MNRLEKLFTFAIATIYFSYLMYHIALMISR